MTANSKGNSSNRAVSNEHKALIEFADRLGSSINTDRSPDAAAPGAAATAGAAGSSGSSGAAGGGGASTIDLDDTNMRQDAKLLMGLLSRPVRLDGVELEAVSASDNSDAHSYASSDSSSSRRDYFSFTCPSLSLDKRSGAAYRTSCSCDRVNSTSSSSSSSHLDSVKRRLPVSLTRSNSSNNTMNRDPSSDVDPAIPPSLLLGRRLKVDDRDALRLSADAMARNVLQSFQKAIEWRVRSWVESLSSILVRKEQELVRAGAPQDEIKKLLGTSEARLILHLRAMMDKENGVDVVGSTTSFRVLPQRVDKEGNTTHHCHRADDEGHQPPLPKKQRMIVHETSDFEEGEYQYNMTYTLCMECAVKLRTPAGFSEITLQVPGTVDGTFLSAEKGPEELKSVVLELNTNMLAAMVEKGCRTIVRTSMETVLAAATTAEQPPAQHHQLTVATTSSKPCMVSPTPRLVSADSASPQHAIVTPKSLFSDAPGSHHQQQHLPGASPKPILLPIPDDLSEEKSPRRISPPPPPHTGVGGGYHLAPRNSSSTAAVPTSAVVATPFPSLVSPPPNHQPYRKAASGKGGPSLPMLVEVAKRELHSTNGS